MKCLALAPAVLALVVSNAQADQLVHRSRTVLLDAGPSMQVIVPKFDPRMGELQAIRVRMTPRIGGRLGIENMSRYPRLGAAEAGLNVSLHYPANSRRPLVESRPRVTASVFLDRIDGLTDYAGPGGASFDLDLSEPASVSRGLIDRDKAFFTLRRGEARNVALPVIVRPHLDVVGNWIDSRFEYRGEVEVTVSYVYSAN